MVWILTPAKEVVFLDVMQPPFQKGAACFFLEFIAVTRPFDLLGVDSKRITLDKSNLTFFQYICW
jgi:hypothetical protein